MINTNQSHSTIIKLSAIDQYDRYINTVNTVLVHCNFSVECQIANIANALDMMSKWFSSLMIGSTDTDMQKTLGNFGCMVGFLFISKPGTVTTHAKETHPHQPLSSNKPTLPGPYKRP